MGGKKLVCGACGRMRALLPLLSFLAVQGVQGSGEKPDDQDAKVCPLAYTKGFGLRTSLASANDSDSGVDLSVCKWYERHTCCTEDDANRIHQQATAEFSKFRNITDGCQDLIGLLSCTPCSPDQGEHFRNYTFYGETTPVLTICPEFCDLLFMSCGDVTDTDGRYLKTMYPRAESFCQNFAGVMVSTAGCFSPAARAAPTHAVLLGLASLLAVWSGMW